MHSLLAPNIPVKSAPSGRWTLRDKAPRSAPYLKRWASYLHVRLQDNQIETIANVR